jgi:hypothetical protein
MTSDLLLAFGAVLVAALLCLWASLHLRRRHRLLRDLPTSKAHGVFMGLVELKGTAESPAPLTSRLAGRPCVWYHWKVEERWSRTVTRGKQTRRESGWTTVEEKRESSVFYLQDETGAVQVDPRGATIHPLGFFDQTVTRADPLYYGQGPAKAVASSDHRRRFTERGLPLHGPLYVVGTASERADVVAPHLHAERGGPFLISSREEARVQRGLAGWSWFWWAIGLSIVLGATWVFAQPGHVPGDWWRFAAWAAVGLAGYLLLWALTWVWMVYNSLVNLRERVRQAWSLIEVQLKRRHDLIPPLVSTLQGLAGHEREVQTSLAALRAQALATPPGQPGPDPAALAAGLRAVVERYPAVSAQPGFLALQEELVSTEQRIALARTYYNDIATHFATRLQSIPECWVGRLGKMRPEPLLNAADFERARVQVQFAR